MVICLKRGADLHIAQRMPLLLTVYCFSKIQIGFTFLVPAYPGSPGQRAVKCVCVCVFVVEDMRSSDIYIVEKRVKFVQFLFISVYNKFPFCFIIGLQTVHRCDVGYWYRGLVM